jgi:hypothetical protein
MQFYDAEDNDCSYGGPIDINGTFYAPPFPATTSKCWAGERITLNIHVPDSESIGTEYIQLPFLTKLITFLNRSITLVSAKC